MPHRSFPYLFILLLTAGFTAPARATSFVERVWLLDEGLPHHVVHKVVQDSRGFLWVSTGEGIARFDGHEFKDYSPTFPGDFRQFARDLALAPDDSLVVLPAAGGVYTMKERSLQRHPLDALTNGQPLFAVHIESSGAVWVAAGIRLFRWSEGRLQMFGPEQGFALKYGGPCSFAEDKAGTVWITAGSDILHYREGSLSALSTTTGGSVFVAPTRAGDVWVVAQDCLMRSSQKEPLQLISDDPAWARIGEVMSAFEDRSGALWIASRNHGLFRFSEGRLENVPVSHMRLSMVTQDDEGNIWVASNGGGLMRLRPRVFIEPPAVRGIELETTSSVTLSEEGTLWLAHRENGLVSWKNNQLKFVGPLLPPPNKFYLTCADREGRVWATTTDGLYRFPAGNPENIERVSEISWPVYAMYCAKNGDLWTCSDQGRIGFFRDDRYHPVSDESAIPEGRIGAFAEGGSGEFWMATQEGVLLKWIDGRLVRDTAYDRLFANRIHALHVDREGSLWIGARVGLIRKRGDSYHLLTTDQGLPDDLIIQILEDDSRHLWIGSRRGLYRVSLDELDAVAEGRAQRVGAFTLGRNEGLVGAYSFIGGPPTAVKARGGMLWFATHRGVVGIDPAIQPAVAPPPRIYIDEMAVHGHRTEISNETSVRITATDSPLEFRFAAVYFSSPQKVRIRHRLEGLDTEWTETADQRSATYARLPPGTYQLHVSAGNQKGAWSKVPAVLTIIVEPTWWQTWWFRVSLAILLSATLVFGGRHWSHRRLQARVERLEREQALEKERSRIARDLHDELGGSLTQINLLAERVKRQAGSSDIQKPLRELASRTRSIAGELESIVWSVSPKNATWSALTAFIASFATRFFRDADLACTVETDGPFPHAPLSPDVQQHVLAVAKEAINNVCKHARASHVSMTLGTDAGSFVLRLTDDGTGFDPAAPEHAERNGLTNMRTRAGEIGASLSIESSPGSGTTLALRVPLVPRLHSASTSV